MCTHLHYAVISLREASVSLWRICGQDDKLADGEPNALEKQ